MTDPVARLTTTLEGRYRIVRELGAGGMATVYLADDLKHDRKVALKVLKPELAAVVGAERFVAEIRTTANLRHPHILPLFDSGEASGFLYYVMPYVEGESLRDRLDREKQLPVDEAVAIATKVAGALQAAHEAGVIHRDIKPANILLEKGEPVVADFGIALAVQEAGGGRLTETGLSLGTPYYMSPEQATGDRDPDARSDVYALGAVLYEMLVGEPPFVGGTAQAVLGKILTGSVTLPTEVRRSIPAHVEAAVLTALERLPADRFAGAGAFAQALANADYRAVSGRGGRTGASRRVMGRRRAAARLWPGVFGVALGAAAAYLALRSSVPPPATIPQGVHASLDASPAVVPGIHVAPDGSVLYRETAAGDSGDTRLRRRSPSAITPALLDNGGLDLTTSPDGRWLAYRGQVPGGPARGILRVPLSGGAPLVLWQPDSEHGGFLLSDWSEDGWLYGSVSPAEDRNTYWIGRVPEDGGRAEVVWRAEGARINRPMVLPGGRGIAFSIGASTTDTTRIVVLDVESGDTTTVAQRGANPQWSPTGHIVYLDPQGQLFALPFDPIDLEVQGAALPLGLSTGGWAPFWPTFDVGRSGVLAYVADAEVFSVAERLVLVDPRDGAMDTLPFVGSDIRSGQLDPDGRRLLLGDVDAGVLLVDLGIGSVRRLDPDTVRTGVASPLWSPDASEVGYVNSLRGVPGGSRVSTDDPAAGLQPWFEGHLARPTQWLPSGDLIAEFNGRSDLGVIRATGELDVLLDGPWREGEGRLSPDGRWLAYTSDRDGERRLYLRAYPSLESELLVSEPGEGLSTNFPSFRWSADGRSLHYGVREAPGVVEVGFSDAGANRIVVARSRFEHLAETLRGAFFLDVHPDGRLLMGTGGLPDDRARPPRLMVVTDLAARIAAAEEGR